MVTKKVYRAIGLMSGTSLDGIDVALIETDGYGVVTPVSFLSVPYEDGLREQLRACFGKVDREDADVVAAERAMTLAHAEAVKQLGETADVIGFHGQTIYHAPDDGVTIQIGDGALLAAETGMDVVCDMRSADVAAGGEGAPLLPLYHQALVKSQGLELPVAVLNIGGVANVTWIDEDDILAFDTGPGNALMDDWVQKNTGQRFDEDGRLAAVGTVRDDILAGWMSHSYLAQKPPKSMDRDEWDIADLGEVAAGMNGVSVEDGAATLLKFTAESILKSVEFMKHSPTVWYACGGGRHNVALMEYLAQHIDVRNVDDLGWNGDATEAEGFAYLAVRSVLGKVLSVPGTTGVAEALTGGVFCKAPLL